MRSAWLPAMGFVIAATLQAGVNSALAVITFHERGIVNGALIFSAMALTTFALRYPSSRFVERYGARVIAIPVTLVQMAGCVLASQAHGVISVVIAGLFLGTAWSAMVPVAIALFFERSSPRSRGIAMGAYNLASSVGAAGGALLAAGMSALGLGYTWAIVLCAIGPASALPFVLLSQAAQRTPRKVTA
jgi:MFS family permease